MMRSALRHSNSLGSFRWGGSNGIRRDIRVRPKMSFAEFEALPVGFVALQEFVDKNFNDSDRLALAEIRQRKAVAALQAGNLKTPGLLRMSKGLSQVQLATAMGTSQSAIARLESGAERPAFEKIVKLRAALGVSFDDLMEALNNVPLEG